MTQTTWATTADVTTITGATVTDVQLGQANAVIETLTARLYSISATKIGVRDAEWLKRAVAYQSVWMIAQPDYFQRLEVTNIVEGRKSVGMKELSLILGPMARMNLKRCSWLRSRSLHVRTPFQDGMGPVSSDPDSGANDAYEMWAGM